MRCKRCNKMLNGMGRPNESGYCTSCRMNLIKESKRKKKVYLQCGAGAMDEQTVRRYLSKSK